MTSADRTVDGFFSPNPGGGAPVIDVFHATGKLSLRRDAFLSWPPNQSQLGDPAGSQSAWWDTLRRDLASARARVIAAGPQGIDHVTTIPEAVIALGELDLQQTAKRVAELDSICGDDDPDEPDVDLESLKRLVRVMQANPGWGEPSLALAGENNCIHAEWPVQDGGRVTISFLPSNRVDYTASSAPVTDDDALDIAGHHLEEEAIRNLRWFTDRIVAR